jgi:putative transposase
MVAGPEDYRWSSIHGHLGLKADRLLTLHPVFLVLGPDSATRALRYRELLNQAIASEDIDAIRRHLQQERAWGSPRFQAMVEAALGRPVTVRPPGRPRKTAIADSNGNVL